MKSFSPLRLHELIDRCIFEGRAIDSNDLCHNSDFWLVRYFVRIATFTASEADQARPRFNTRIGVVGIWITTLRIIMQECPLPFRSTRLEIFLKALDRKNLYEYSSIPKIKWHDKLDVRLFIGLLAEWSSNKGRVKCVWQEETKLLRIWTPVNHLRSLG